MAETVKKSRIVSDKEELSVGTNNEDDLEGALMEEFNMRLKSCMSQDDLHTNDDEEVAEEPEGQKTNGYDKVSISINDDFIRAEQESYKSNNGISAAEDNEATDDDKERKEELKSVKDRMLLSTDSSCLLFTQTVTSPMLTPSEEHVDFLKGFKKTPPEESPYENTEFTVPNVDENVPLYENLDAKNAQNEEENLYENVDKEGNSLVEQATSKDEEEEENIYENIPADKDEPDQVIYENVTSVKNEEKNDERKEEMETFEITNKTVEANDSTQQVSESYMETTTIESNVATSDEATKIMKKKKTKKSRKEEKENISVNGTNNNSCTSNNNTTNKSAEETYYNVDVKNLCRSFGDLTRIEESTAAAITKITENARTITTERTLRARSMPDVTSAFNNTLYYQFSATKIDCRFLLKNHNNFRYYQNNNKENVFNGVCVRALKSSFSKFDALQKKNVLHVRSSDSSKAQEKFNGASQQLEISSNCRSCDKPVFQMEQIKAEKSIWHKNCFRCNECNKQLNVDTYESHEGTLYCKPHFKALFAPKAVEEDAPPSDKPDLGLEELQALNVKERFQVFEHFQEQNIGGAGDLEKAPKSPVSVKRSASILSKLARFQSKGMDIGVSDDALNGIPIEASSSEAESASENEEGAEEGEEDADLIRARRVQKEKPFHFTGMSDVKNLWEQQGEQQNARDERREERKHEIQSIRSRLFMGKQGKMKEAYQQAVMESESLVGNALLKEKIEVCDTKSLKERFERGEVVNRDEVDKEKEGDENEVYESEISKKSRSLFQELDANASKAPQVAAPVPKLDVRKAREASTPEREIYRDPEVIRAEDIEEDSLVAAKSHTATKMLNKFRQMEEDLTRESAQPAGLKPLKRFTPPPEPARQEQSTEESGSEEESEEEEEQIQQSHQDEDLLEAQKAARAKQLRAKFERWEVNEMKKEQNNSSVNLIEELGDQQSQIESTRSLRARFESMRETSQDVNRAPRVKVNRFVDIVKMTIERCQSCGNRVYPLEKISVHNHVYHKSCFKCMECGCVLRMDSYSYNQGLLYCIPHFKRLFISKGNYDTGFGFGQHKEKWNNNNQNQTPSPSVA